MLTWLTIASTALKIINTIVQWANRSNLMNEGAKKEIARQTLAVMKSAGLTRELITEVITMTDEEIKDALTDEDFVD